MHTVSEGGVCDEVRVCPFTSDEFAGTFVGILGWLEGSVSPDTRKCTRFRDGHGAYRYTNP